MVKVKVPTDLEVVEFIWSLPETEQAKHDLFSAEGFERAIIAWQRAALLEDWHAFCGDVGLAFEPTWQRVSATEGAYYALVSLSEALARETGMNEDKAWEFCAGMNSARVKVDELTGWLAETPEERELRLEIEAEEQWECDRVHHETRFTYCDD